VFLRVLAAATLVLSLGACVQRDYLVANPSADALAPVETRYTANISYVATIEVIALRIDPVFATGERQEILRAIAEWNHALNGYVRFESIFAVFLADAQRADPQPVRTNSWSVPPARGAAPLGQRVARPMALLQPAPHGGGVVMIFREQVGPAALAAAVRHELGHVLGLLHDPASRLMSPVHDPAGQRRIDKATVAAVARMRGLPINELNWCEEGQTAG
jgi:predicted Zn-dependent protease